MRSFHLLNHCLLFCLSIAVECLLERKPVALAEEAPGVHLPSNWRFAYRVSFCVADAHGECSVPADSCTQPLQLSGQTSVLATLTCCLTCRFFGWTKANEITNGRWVMFGFAVGLLTEFATGVDFPHQCALF